MNQYPCPAGYYCPSESAYPIACPAGYFNINIMMTQESDCTNNPCPTNFFCNVGTKYPQPCVGVCDPSILAPSAAPVTCLAGTYSGNDSPISAAACNTCWEGHYCEEALASLHLFPTRCPKGTYQPDTGKSSIADCLTCPEGVVCPYEASREMDTGLVC